MKILPATLLIFVIFQTSIAQEEQKRYTREHWDQANRFCSEFLRTPQAARDKIERQQFDDDNDTAMHCMLRCNGIVSLTYQDDAGTVMEAMAIQAKGKTGFEEYRRAAEECYAGFGPEDYGDDWCKKAYLYFKCDLKAWKEHVKEVE